MKEWFYLSGVSNTTQIVEHTLIEKDKVWVTHEETGQIQVDSYRKSV